MPLDIPELLDRLCYRYPSLLIDGVIEHEPGRRIVAVKNVTVGEEFFQGHFPGTPLMPGVLMIEALAQAASILLLDRDVLPSAMRTMLRGVNNARFRRQVVPGDRLHLEVTVRAPGDLGEQYDGHPLCRRRDTPARTNNETEVHRAGHHQKAHENRTDDRFPGKAVLEFIGRLHESPVFFELFVLGVGRQWSDPLWCVR